MLDCIIYYPRIQRIKGTENTAPLESGAAGRGGRPGAAHLHVITEDDLKLLISGSARTLEIRKFKLSGVVV